MSNGIVHIIGPKEYIYKDFLCIQYCTISTNSAPLVTRDYFDAFGASAPPLVTGDWGTFSAPGTIQHSTLGVFHVVWGRLRTVKYDVRCRKREK